MFNGEPLDFCLLQTRVRSGEFDGGPQVLFVFRLLPAAAFAQECSCSTTLSDERYLVTHPISDSMTIPDSGSPGLPAAPDSIAPILSLDDVTKDYLTETEPVRALDHVSLQIERGRFVANDVCGAFLSL